MFEITEQKGFHITFENGCTISVQFGYGNYCDNRHMGLFREEVEPCKNAEIAVWTKDNEWITEKFVDCGGDEVCGYLEADKVADIIYAVKNYKEKP